MVRARMSNNNTRNGLAADGDGSVTELFEHKRKASEVVYEKSTKVGDNNTVSSSDACSLSSDDDDTNLYRPLKYQRLENIDVNSVSMHDENLVSLGRCAAISHENTLSVLPSPTLTTQELCRPKIHVLDDCSNVSSSTNKVIELGNTGFMETSSVFEMRNCNERFVARQPFISLVTPGSSTLDLEKLEDTWKNNLGKADSSNAFSNWQHTNKIDLLESNFLKRRNVVNLVDKSCASLIGSEEDIATTPSLNFKVIDKQVLVQHTKIALQQDKGQENCFKQQVPFRTKRSGGVCWKYVAVPLSFIILFSASISVLIWLKFNPHSQEVFQQIVAKTWSSGPVSESSVYVSGGGFSGFWFTLGRLQSIEDPLSKNYYCYSAGCLGVVASFSNHSMEFVRETAFAIQDRWKLGELNRYDVVDTFVSELLSCSNQRYNVEYGSSFKCSSDANGSKLIHPLEDPTLLSRIHIITTKVNEGGRWSFPQTEIRKAKSLEELKYMLLQTTWIPYAVGNGISLDGHMDGAFGFNHPFCKHHLGLAPDLELIANVININLGRDKVESLWNKGLAYGM